MQATIFQSSYDCLIWVQSATAPFDRDRMAAQIRQIREGRSLAAGEPLPAIFVVRYTACSSHH